MKVWFKKGEKEKMAQLQTLWCQWDEKEGEIGYKCEEIPVKFTLNNHTFLLLCESLSIK